MSNHSRIAPFAVLLLLLLATPAARAAANAEPAQKDTAIYVLPLETVVAATRQNIPLRESPSATSVVTRESMDRPIRGIAAGEALAGVPGMRVDAPADGERVHLAIRGQGILAESGIRGIKVLLDGLPLNDPTGVAADLYDVDWATVDRVEVLRGPAATLYGGGGSGGAINIITADGADVPVGGRALVEGGSYGFQKTLAEVGGTSQHLNYRLAMSEAAGDGWRDHNAFNGDNLYGKLRWTPNDRVDVTQVLAWTDYKEENAEGLNAEQVQENPQQGNPDAAPFNEMFKVDRFTTGLNAHINVAKDQNLRLAGYLRSTAYLEPRPHELIRDSYLEPGASLQYDIDSHMSKATNHLSIGGDGAWQGLDELILQNDGRAKQDSMLANGNLQQRGFGAFALDRVELSKEWSVLAGLRYDYIWNKFYDSPLAGVADATGARSFSQVTGRVGAAWAPLPQFNLYANWSQGFQPPSNEEMANNPAGYSGFNETLDPATSNGEEIGMRGVFERKVSYEFCGFMLDTKNDFDRYRLSEREGLTFYRNAGSSHRFGFESRGSWKPIHFLSLDASYTWSHFRYTAPAAIDGNQLPNCPEHMLNFDAEIELMKGLKLSIDTDMLSDWQLDTQNSTAVPGYALWNASLAYDWHAGTLRGTAAIGGRNLFSANYFNYTEPDPDGNSYQPGAPAEIFARVSVAR